MCNNLEEQMQSMENKQMVLIQPTAKKVHILQQFIHLEVVTIAVKHFLSQNYRTSGGRQKTF